MMQILFCNSEAGLRITGFLGTLISVIKIVVPIILIVVGTISLVKCIINQDKDNTKKEIMKLVKKAILGVTIFLVPSIVMFLVNLVGENTNGQKCMSCLLDSSSNCIKEAEDLKSGKTDSLPSIYNGKPEECKYPNEYVDGYCQGEGW